MNNLVLRFLFAAALLMQWCLVCGLARAQSQTDFRAANSDSSVAVAPAPLLATQLPATDDSLTAETPPDDRSRFSSAVIDPGNLFVLGFGMVLVRSLSFNFECGRGPGIGFRLE